MTTKTSLGTKTIFAIGGSARVNSLHNPREACRALHSPTTQYPRVDRSDRMRMYNNPKTHRRVDISLDKMRELRAEGYTIGQLAEHFKVTPTTITNRLRKESLTLDDITPDDVRITPGRRIHEVDLEEVKRLRAKEYSVARIARKLKVPPRAIYYRLGREGLTIADITPENAIIRRITDEDKEARYRERVPLSQIDEMRRLRAEGYTIGQLAKHLMVTPSTITSRLGKEGLTLDDITPDDVSITPGRRIHEVDLEEVKRLRAKKYSVLRIARELKVPPNAIYYRLGREGLTIADITPDNVTIRRVSDEDREAKHRERSPLSEIDEMRWLRAEGYTIGRLAEHFKVTPSTITHRLRKEGLTLDDITPDDVSITPGREPKSLDIKAIERAKAQGLTQKETAKKLHVSVATLKQRLKKLDLRWSDLPRHNPFRPQGSALAKTTGFGVGAAATSVVDYTLRKTTELSPTKRHLISGVTVTATGLSVYAHTKREDTLWATYGSLFATVGHFIYDKIKG